MSVFYYVLNLSQTLSQASSIIDTCIDRCMPSYNVSLPSRGGGVPNGSLPVPPDICFTSSSLWYSWDTRYTWDLPPPRLCQQTPQILSFGRSTICPPSPTLLGSFVQKFLLLVGTYSVPLNENSLYLVMGWTFIGSFKQRVNKVLQSFALSSSLDLDATCLYIFVPTEYSVFFSKKKVSAGWPVTPGPVSCSTWQRIRPYYQTTKMSIESRNASQSTNHFAI